MRLTSYSLYSSLLVFLFHCTHAADVVGVAREPIPEDARTLLLKCLDDFQPTSNIYPHAKEITHSSFEAWSRAPWPILKGLQRVHVQLPDERKKDTKIYLLDRRDFNAWQLPDGRLLLDDFSERAVREFETVKPMDYAAELREMAAYSELCNKSVKNQYNAPISFVFHHMAATHDSSRYYLCAWDSFHHAYAAATLGFPELVPPLVQNALGSYGQLKQDVLDHLARARMEAAMKAFASGSSRETLLQEMMDTHLFYPGSACDWEVVSLIGPLKQELKDGEPPYLRKAVSERSHEEHIRALIWQLRDIHGSQMGVPGYPDLFGTWNYGQRKLNPAQELVEIGPAAVPYLIDSLEDYTPTRTVGFRWTTRLLRRMDVAINVLNSLTGCCFYTTASTSGDLHNDKPERRQATIARVKKWWAESQGLTQSQMLRNILAQPRREGAGDPIYVLWALGNLDGPEHVLSEIEKLTSKDNAYLGHEALNALDRQRSIVEAFKRFEAGTNKDWEYGVLFEYGNKATYQQIMQRFEKLEILDANGHWELGAQGESAAKNGGNWALPILGKLLLHSELQSYGSTEYIAKPQTYSDAEQIMPWFEKLSEKSFGYDVKAPRPERLEAVKKALSWWQTVGQAALKEKIEADHPASSGTTDQFLSEDEIERRAAALAGDDPAARRKALSEMGNALSFKTQRALLTALAKETDEPTRLSILKAFGVHAGLWAVPELARVLDQDSDPQTRLLAAQAMVAPITNKGSAMWWIRMETREAGLSVARRLVADRKTSRELRRAALDILMGWASARDSDLLISLMADPDFVDYLKFQNYIQRWQK